MHRIHEITAFLKQFAPLELAEDWDNVGLLIGNEADSVSTILTCLTLTPDVAAEAIKLQSQLIVTHHPLLFRPVQRLTAQDSQGAMLLELLANRIAVYSPHTSYDSAQAGINQQLAESLGLMNIAPLRPRGEESRPQAEPHVPVAVSDAVPGPVLGAGRYGDLPEPITLADLNLRIKSALGVARLQFVGETSAKVSRVGVACGSAAEFLRDAQKLGCQALLTGEARFHDCLDARTRGMALILPGHYATERPAMERMADLLGGQFPDLSAQASRTESDPLQWD